jgi:hypothetical protein
MATATKKNAGKATAKKTADKKDAGKKKPSPAPRKDLMSYDEAFAKLQARAQTELEKEANTGAEGSLFMNVEGKEFSIGDEEEFGDSIQVVVLASSFFNAYYDSPYVPGQKSAPACYAVASSEDEMAPADNAPAPQADACANCPLNEYESAANGRGKACSNKRRLAFILLADLEAGNPRIVQMNIPPTGLKFWGRYVKSIARQYSMSPAGVVTRFDFDEDNPQPCPIPTFEGTVDKGQLSLVVSMVEEADELVLAKVNTDDYEAPGKKKAGKVGQRGGAAGKAKPAAGKGKATARGGSGKPAARGRR